MKTKLSIIIPALNEERYIGRLLKSIEEQDYPCEVIVADAHSKDNTKKVAKSFGVKVISSKRGKPAYGRNAAVKVAKGNLFLFLDADVVLPKGFLKRNVADFKKKRLDIGGGYLRSNNKKIYDWIAMDVIADTWLYFVQNIYPYVYGACIFIKRDVFKKLKGFDETITFAEDIDLARRAFFKGYKFGMLRKPAFVSMRRFEKEGRFSLGIKYAWLHAQEFWGAIRSKQNYKYGDY